ncbi:MAG TPA: hypothetical protein VF234_05595 [Limnochordia bacterium]
MRHTFLGLRIPIVITAFLAVLALAWGAQWFFYRTRVAAPLKTGFEGIPGVAGVSLRPAGTRTDLWVHLTSGADLFRAYAQLEAVGREVLGADLGVIHIVDNRTPELDRAYHALHFALQEGAATGHFVEMAERAERLASEWGLDEHRIVVGDRYIFVQLRSGARWLYAALPRRQPGSIGSDGEFGPDGRLVIQPGDGVR